MPTVVWEHTAELSGHPSFVLGAFNGWLVAQRGGQCDAVHKTVSMLDAGHYHCIAENEHGKTLANAFLAIGGMLPTYRY